ncbi:hypothetical protein PIB30_047400 [Stylosanthes scabra]|uniref:Uncharacterized protein n=1 Tax=Stylosanthes scabra TaxID=79078 RepID=A0ABU6QG79_9FABA|nr:hypothetical protein [Stylosanthes scabra]
MEGLLKKRKGKAVAQSSGEVPRFKTPFHEAHFKGKLSTRKVQPEVAIDYNDDILSPCAIQMKMRKWEKSKRITAPLQAVGHNLVKEFYANAWKPDKAKRKPYTYTTMVQGKDISFAPKDIKRVLKLKKDPLLMRLPIMRGKQTRIIGLKRCKNACALKEENGSVTKMESLIT